MSLRRVLVSSLLGFVIISLGLGFGYLLESKPLADYESMAFFVFLSKQWYLIPCIVCFGFLLCGFLGEVLLMLLGKADGEDIYW